MWFADIWVTPIYDDEVVPEVAQSERRDAARRFVAYINAPSTFEWIHLNKDAEEGKSVPRYLIPATVSAFQETAIGRDPVMSQIWPLLGEGTFFPQRRLPGLRRAMGAAVEAEWTKTDK